MQVVYRGASNSHLDQIDGESSSSKSSNDNRNKSINSSNGNNSNSGNSNNVMSMKKSAEIAAVFSGAKINQTTNIVDNYNDDEQRALLQRRQQQQQQHSFSEANMQSSLGYFP